jgi:hypothetical protein
MYCYIAYGHSVPGFFCSLLAFHSAVPGASGGSHDNLRFEPVRVQVGSRNHTDDATEGGLLAIL